MAETMQPYPTPSRARDAAASPRNHLIKRPNNWYVKKGLDTRGLEPKETYDT